MSVRVVGGVADSQLGQRGTCVETRFTADAVHVRNNQRPNAGTATFTHEEWAVFVAGVRDGDYDL